MDTKNDLSYVQAASALAMDQGDFSNLLKAKRFVGRKSYRNKHLISRDEIATVCGRVLTDAEFARARTVKAKDTRRKTSKQLEVTHEHDIG